MATTDEIFDYVMTSPYNTNPNQLRTMLDSIGGGGGLDSIMFRVPIIAEYNDQTATYTYHLDNMTYNDIESAITEGKIPYIHTGNAIYFFGRKNPSTHFLELYSPVAFSSGDDSSVVGFSVYWIYPNNNVALISYGVN